MDRKTIEDFEKAHGYILPESYINFLLVCDNKPENYCMDYGDINLFPGYFHPSGIHVFQYFVKSPHIVARC